MTISICSAVLFLGLVFCFYLGFHMGKLSKVNGGSSVLNGAVFGLLSLLLAFSFSGAAERFQHRRDLITKEANAVGTAYLRLDLLPSGTRASLRKSMQQYLQSRLDIYQAKAHSPAAQAAYQRSTELQNKIWTEATTAAQKSGNAVVLSLVSSSLNDMFDVTIMRLAATRSQPPRIITILLFVIAWISAFLAGYGMTDHIRIPWVQVIIFSATLAITVFMILDLEYPRLGLTRINSADRLLIETLHEMKAATDSRHSQQAHLSH